MNDSDEIIRRIHDHIDNGDIDKAVIACLRLSRCIGDHFNAVMFLREMRPDHHQFEQQFSDEVKSLSIAAQKHVWRTTGECWLEEHTVDAPPNPDKPDNTVIGMGIGEMLRGLKDIERTIADMVVPRGMGELDTAAFHDRYGSQKALLRLKTIAISQVVERVRTRCANYVSRVESQLRTERKPIEFLASVQNTVNNYFAARSEQAYRKLQRASELAGSTLAEDHALLLTSVRRAIKTVADHFFPASDVPRTCSDGKVRVLGDDQYLNRLEEFCSTLPASSSSDLLKAELAHLSTFARRLNEIASKGVHAEVTSAEAKQGLLGLYMFTSNLISRIEQNQGQAQISSRAADAL